MLIEGVKKLENRFNDFTDIKICVEKLANLLPDITSKIVYSNEYQPSYGLTSKKIIYHH